MNPFALLVSETMNSVSMLNTQAVSLMTEEKFIASASLLEKGLSMLANIIALDPIPTYIVRAPIIRQLVVTPRPFPGDEDSSFFLYKNGFIIQPSSSELSSLIKLETLLEMFYCVMLYNLGLGLHLQAFSEGCNTDYLNEAQAAYGSAIMDFEACWRESSMKVLELAVNNNSAHICHFQLQMDDAHAMLLRMTALLSEVTMGGKLVPPSVACFVKNVYHNQRVFDRMAPAA